MTMEWPQWPHDSYFVFETYGDAPGSPGLPHVQHISRDVYQVLWQSADGNDGDDLVYELQMRAKDEEFSDWMTVYNSSNTQWIIKSISGNANYEFRVRAINEYGGSNYSFSYEPFFLPQTDLLGDQDLKDDPDQVAIIAASGLGSLILLTIAFAVVCMVHRRREKEKKIIEDSVTQNQLAPELELATLQELPRHGNFVHQTNALYNLGDLPTDEELLALPRVERDQIVLKKFLGCGAFGEVFEGVVHNLSEGLPPMKIAIKTLRKGATDFEKEEFLKEAKLMSNFKHNHILQLLGVCYDNNPNFIILELMEGGDLLSYLRYNRPSLFQRSLLTLDDLLSICVDVAEGCKYLEDMHFVHRDLAARNCLVSSFNREQRVVKIGDFGLARDIYKNDYYRKVGEGLLPVRWMAPESLVYGIFTSQSDVWAFGVLLWEVMTLGQQPYPARTNTEVLHFVRGGGRLDKPENCPDDLHEVMIKCWSYDPEGRPSFSYCLTVLQELKQKALNSPSSVLSAVQNENYLSHSISGGYIIANGGEVNNSTLKDNSEQDADRFSIQSDPVRSVVMQNQENQGVKRSASLNHGPEFCERLEFTADILGEISGRNNTNGHRFLQNYNKYLELLADNEPSDGYEIPLRALVSDFNYNLSTDANNHCSNNSCVIPQEVQEIQCAKSFLKPVLAPFYAEVFSGSKTNTNGCFPLECSELNSTKEKNTQNDNLFTLECSYPTKTHNGEVTSSHNCLNSRNPINGTNNDSDEMDCHICSDNDRWSLSTSSTVPCDLYFKPTSLRNSTTSMLSSGTELSLNHISSSSIC